MAAEKRTISAIGLLKDVEFHMVKAAAETISRKDQDGFNEPYILGLLECDWDAFIRAKRKEMKKEVWGFKEDVITFLDDELIGGHEQFLKWAMGNHGYKDFRPLPLWHAMAKETYKNYLLETGHEFLYMDVEVNHERVGRLVIELFSERLPRTCCNFRELCLGTNTETERHDPPLKLWYKDSIFHRVVPNGWIQGGDIEGGKGTGGESIYGPLFEDEDFSIPHSKRGIVGMANKGRHTNGSQFYITLQPAPWMDTKYVAFGQVIEGSKVLAALEEQETFNERPKTLCVIADCGLFDVEKL
ncbi:probable inactive peptidyl-prolyl cis-trans isomerase-like 6 isoform X1 [Acropora muricata]|uniref:peptidyl-prolyl cis-trans isomerase-like isoform X1 n=1 Tax=Acropora millepora TaxID=45264 RepID=UPI001CF4C917|nr:peptidyl-prolyl cis-trans isomerase-like isoform X1 [Acropora millepora]